MFINRDRLPQFVFVLLLLFYAFYLWDVGKFIESGGDATYYWHFSKQMLCGDLKSLYWTNHKSIRFAILGPVMAFQWLFGEEPNVYFYVPIFMSLLVFVLVWIISSHLLGRGPAFLVVFILWSMDDLQRESTQLLPNVFATTCFLMFLILTYTAVKSSRHQIWSAVVAGIVCYLGYTVKIPELFFIFGAMVPLFLNSSTRKVTLITGGVLGLMVIVETLVFNYFFGLKFGSLEIANRSHNVFLKTQPVSVIQLVSRFFSLPGMFKVMALVSIFGLLLSVKKKNLPMCVIGAGVLGYLLLNLVAVKSLNPLLPAIRIIPRYYTGILPLQSIILVWLIKETLTYVGGWKFVKRAGWLEYSYALLAVGMLPNIVSYEKGDTEKVQKVEDLLSEMEEIAAQKLSLGVASHNNSKEVSRLIQPACVNRKGPRLLENQARLDKIFEYFNNDRKDTIKVIHHDFASTSLLVNGSTEILKNFFGGKSGVSLKCADDGDCVAKILLDRLKVFALESKLEIHVFEREKFRVVKSNFAQWLVDQHTDQFQKKISVDEKRRKLNLQEIPNDIFKDTLDGVN